MRGRGRAGSFPSTENATFTMDDEELRRHWQMSVTERIEELSHSLAPAQCEGQSIGLVPTMGYLPARHLALMRRRARRTTSSWRGIFVNPLQFRFKEDFQRYPRDLARDTGLAREAGVDSSPLRSRRCPHRRRWPRSMSRGSAKAVWRAPRAQAPSGRSHIVAKLFNIAQPDQRRFGQKDYQQLLVIRRMVRVSSFQSKWWPCLRCARRMVWMAAATPI